MPFRSDKQRKAMYAAARGKSNIGIPQKAAQSFVSHSSGKPLLGVMTKRITDGKSTQRVKQSQ